jgi:hypothetical protein
MNTLYEQLLLFPDRAENLGQYSTYDVDLAHWKTLSALFRDKFRSVYERGSSAVLMVHGAQGTGKTLFSRRLADDFEKAAKGAIDPDRKNLWHTLVGEDPMARATIEAATRESVLRRVSPSSEWLATQRTFVKDDTHRVRIFVLDDAHKDVFMREWAGLSQADYLGFKERKADHIALASVAERLVEDCRGDFVRSIFLLLSNDSARMAALKNHMDESHVGLATVLELPLPDAATKEQIIRKNTNRLNRMSYWYCLDAAGKDERSAAYDVLTDNSKGFTESFHAIDKALRSSNETRPGRPANRNQITLVTLGTPVGTAKAFLEDQDLAFEEHHRGSHVGVWWMRDRWASALYEGNDQEISRRARMLESEFWLRWVALNIRSTFALCQPPSLDDVGQRILGLIQFVPSIGKPDDVKKHSDAAARLDAEVDAVLVSTNELDTFEQQFASLGQRRSSLYEPAIMKRLPDYGRGFADFPLVKPDFIASEYRACAVTAAPSRFASDITAAIRRSCHAIEFTAHLQSDMAGLAEYLLEKVGRYGLLLESV